MKMYFWYVGLGEDLYLLVMPKQLDNYKRTYGEYAKANVEDTGKRLFITQLWLPLSLATLAMGMELLPLTEKAWHPQYYLIVSVVTVVVWLWMGAFFGSIVELVGTFAFFVAILVAMGVAFGVTGGVAFGITYFIALFVMGIVEYGINKDSQHYFVVRIAFVLLLSSYAFLIWFFYLGGWQMFK
jgi:hypothetical protein